uniref:Uncharacterized protein n=1 Tax=Zea mays TaxID=4577 RepID=A0A804N7M7_MAIZE
MVNRGGGEGESLGTVFLALQCAAHLAAAAVVVHEKPFRSAAHPLALRHDVGVVGRGKEERAADRGIVGSGRTGNAAIAVALVRSGRRRRRGDKGSSGEEVVPAKKRRGRPQKRFASKIDQADVENFVEQVDADQEADDAKLKNSAAAGGTKRGRPLKEGSNIAVEDTNSTVRLSSDELTRTNGFRQIGSQLKN